jgi:tRNA(Ile)-lysidine synthase
VDQLAQRLLKTIRKQGSIRAGDRLAVAVSGGADSVALLRLLLDLRHELGIVLSVAHVNHNLRAEESDQDELFVADLARQHNLQFHVSKAPLHPTVASGIEAAARELRYAFFRQLARSGRVSKIATAHTLDDQAETLLLRISRGTGIRGLSGIHPRIVFSEQQQAFGELVRPLLDFRRSSLHDFLRERGQTWREDSSNRDLAFLRNRVRHRLLPLIAEEFGDAAIAHLSELADIARAEEDHWDHFFSTIHPSPSLPLAPLLALDLATQRRLIRLWLNSNAPDLSISFRLIEHAINFAQASADRRSLPDHLELSAFWNLHRTRHFLCLEPKPTPDATADYEYTLTVPGSVLIPQLAASIEARLVEAREVPEDLRAHLLDPDRLPRQIAIRNWRAGDRFWPAHTSAPKKVKELLSDRHLNGTVKKNWPVAVAHGDNGDGLIWILGFPVPANAQPPRSASHAIWIRQVAPMM